MTEQSALRAIVDLLPRYLRTRRVGWTPLPEMQHRVALPEYVLLRGVASELDDAPISYAELRARLFNPYNTIVPILERLPRLVELGLLEQTGDRYSLSAAGRELLTRAERSANDYAAGRMRLPADELERLASTLHEIAERLRRATEPAAKAHQQRIPRLRRFDERTTPPIELEYAVYALWMARDDAHNAAWRAAGFQGPSLDLLSRVWAGEASTGAELVNSTRDSMRSEDVDALLGELERDGLLTRQADSVTLTARGREVRDRIEQETDRVYFAPWPAIDAGWARSRLEALVEGLIAPIPAPGTPGTPAPQAPQAPQAQAWG